MAVRSLRLAVLILTQFYGQLTSGGSAKWVVDPVSPEQALSSVYTLNNAAVDKMKASPDPKALTEAEGTFSAGESGLLGGNSFLYEYAPSIYDGMDDVSGTTGIVFITRAGQEGSDKKYDAYTDGTPHYLALKFQRKRSYQNRKRKMWQCHCCSGIFRTDGTDSHPEW